MKDAIPTVTYLPYRQNKSLGAASFYVTTAVPVELLLPALRRVAAELDANLLMEDVRTLEAQVKKNISLDRLISTLAAAFAMLATLLAAVGLYGVLAFTVQRRTREIGIRLAVCADAVSIRNMVMKEVGWMVILGIVIGVPGAVGFTRFA